ncbi:MAG: type IX secretion system membrane protein PorP/SprF [Bacteroidales bacterium]|nr:type IX secretion system membrane protein PorP/SprF [Bacteroidales bacterium]
MSKIVLFLASMMLFLSAANAQNEGQYTHFMFNRLSYNPAYAGSSGNISLTALYRNQWLGLNLQAPTGVSEAGSTPTNILFSFDMPVSWLHGGIGLNFNSEKVGYHDNLNMALDYAFRIFWGPGNLAAAIEVDLYNYKFNTEYLRGSDDLDGDPTSSSSASSDPLVNSSATSDFLIDFSTGLYYQVPGLWYVSLSAKNLLGSKSESFNFHNVRTYYLMAGYEYRFPYNPSITLKPSMLVKTAEFSVFQADFACLVDYENIFWGGLGYRWGDSFNILAGVNFLKYMRVGVAYDLTTSKMGFGNGRSIGSAEFFLNGSFQINVPKRPPTVSRNTIHLY